MPSPTENRLNKTDLVKAVAEETGALYDDAYRAVTAVFDVIARNVATGKSIAITNFGTFLPKQAPERMAHNPQTGEKVLVPAKQAARFRPSPRLIDAVAAGDPTQASTFKNRNR